ncbi:ferritin-like domain-containing protein [Mycena maculata]|uniref:Ferritin-like domain-containing protein n=1 Tax=Mycena maculata TaxID=230809 RepID=A0AAD7P0C4_9AGAR|nr:ferritin-like domain-containing protein [Mycena maculata]
MKFSILTSVLAAFSLAQVAHALPTKRDITDPQVLNYALTLEHLEAKFYADGLAKFSEADFTKAGYPEWTYGRVTQIAAHEATHVTFLTTALQTAGAKAVEACEYNFPITDVKSFVSLAGTLEAIGSAGESISIVLFDFHSPVSSAYTGGAQDISSKDYLTAAASILAVEARHAAWISAAAEHGSPWDTAFQTPLSPNPVYSLAAPFIVSCPAANSAALPSLTAYPALAFADAHARAGTTATLTFASNSKASFVAFVSGAGTPVFVPLQSGNRVAIPGSLRGLVFVFVTSDGGRVDDSTTIAGPALLNVAFDSRGNVV